MWTDSFLVALRKPWSLHEILLERPHAYRYKSATLEFPCNSYKIWAGKHAILIHVLLLEDLEYRPFRKCPSGFQDSRCFDISYISRLIHLFSYQKAKNITYTFPNLSYRLGVHIENSDNYSHSPWHIVSLKVPCYSYPAIQVALLPAGSVIKSEIYLAASS